MCVHRQHVKCTCYSYNMKVLFRMLLGNCCNFWLFSGLQFLNISQHPPPNSCFGDRLPSSLAVPLTKNTLVHLCNCTLNCHPLDTFKFSVKEHIIARRKSILKGSVETIVKQAPSEKIRHMCTLKNV